METNEKLISVLNDLVEINNDRVTGYTKAGNETRDLDLDMKVVFEKMASQSRNNLSELKDEVIRLGGTPAQGTTNAGKIYHAWMDLKATFTGHDRQAVLDSCEYGEDAAQKAYRSALASDAEIPADTRQIITQQQASLKTSHDLIKKYRDLNKSVHA